MNNDTNKIMKKEAIHISTIPVNIKIIQVGGKKLTASVFNQIPIDDAFYSKLSNTERADCFIGWVERDSKYILYSQDNILLRFKVDDKVISSSSDWDYKRNNYQKNIE